MCASSTQVVTGEIAFSSEPRDNEETGEFRADVTPAPRGAHSYDGGNGELSEERAVELGGMIERGTWEVVPGCRPGMRYVLGVLARAVSSIDPSLLEAGSIGMAGGGGGFLTEEYSNAFWEDRKTYLAGAGGAGPSGPSVIDERTEYNGDGDGGEESRASKSRGSVYGVDVSEYDETMASPRPVSIMRRASGVGLQSFSSVLDDGEESGGGFVDRRRDSVMIGAGWDSEYEDDAVTRRASGAPSDVDRVAYGDSDGDPANFATVK